MPWLCRRGNYGDIRDAAEIERDAAKFGMTIEKIVDVRNEWSALAAECHVGGTKVGDGSDAGARGDDAGLADLKSGDGGAAEVIGWLPLVEDGLTVIADEIDASRRNTELFTRGENSVGIDVSEAEVQLAQFASGNGSLLGDAKNLFAQRGRKVERSVAEQLGVELRRRAGDAGKRDIDAIGGSAGHKAENKERLRSHRTKSFNTGNAENTVKEKDRFPTRSVA